MTLADRLKAAILEHGPMAECHLATTVRKRREEVAAELHRHPDRFIHNGLKARASKWDVRPEVENGPRAPSYTVAELAERWRLDEGLVHTFVLGPEGFLERGFLESVNGNGQVRVTELGLRVSHQVNGAA